PCTGFAPGGLQWSFNFDGGSQSTSSTVQHFFVMVYYPAAGPAALTIASPSSLSSGTVGTAYSNAQFGATGGTDSYTWSATGLPGGLLFSSSGLLSGTPATGSQGNYTVQFTVRDSNNATASITLALTISAGPSPPPIISSISPS